tara:strand:+ start:440 stop:862 length:423 start_codon:yes stop_codon:yes gene_type:complete
MNLSASEVAEFSISVRVYIEDTDAGGIIFYANYLKYMERARTELMRCLGFNKEFILNSNLMFVVQNVSLRYLEAGYLDQELRITARIKDCGAAYVLLEHTVMREQSILVCGDIKIVSVNKKTMKPTRMPESVYAAIQAAI